MDVNAVNKPLQRLWFPRHGEPSTAVYREALGAAQVLQKIQTPQPGAVHSGSQTPRSARRLT